nr:malate dehydrogenase [uncultured bacterium]
MMQKADHDISDFIGRYLPIGALRRVAAGEFRRDRTGHHVADANVVVPHFLHQRFAERVQTSLRRAVRGGAGERIRPGQTADIDDVAAAAASQVRQGGVARVEGPGEIRVEDFGPCLRRHVADVREDTNACVVDNDVEAPESGDRRRDRALDCRVLTHVGFKRLQTAGARAFKASPRLREMRPASAGNRHLRAIREERVCDREADASRSSGHNRDFPVEPRHGYYNSARMREVAIVGAGELGGLVAHVLARRDTVECIHLIDENGRVAQGKALDIGQAAPLERFATRVIGSTDLYSAAGAEVVVVADRAGGREWSGDEGLDLIRRLEGLAPRAAIVCAGASQRGLVERGVRELGVASTRLLGSAPEALVAAARAIVALEQHVSPADVTLTVLGVPPARIVVAWEGGAIGGLAITRVLSDPVRRRLTEKIAALWPTGPYTLASAAGKVVEILAGASRQTATCFAAPADAAGVRVRAGAMPIRLGPTGLVEVILPDLSPGERVALDNAMML